MQLTEQEIVRRDNLQKIKELGIDPFPPEAFPVDTFAKEVEEGFDPEKENFQDVCMAGRIMMKRVMGKAAFAEIQDSSGSIQIYLIRRRNSARVKIKAYTMILFKKLLDIGDFVGIKGYRLSVPARRRDLTVHVTEFIFLSKSLQATAHR
jgi:lysyl-tRNA synthetase class 2